MNRNDSNSSTADSILRTNIRIIDGWVDRIGRNYESIVVDLKSGRLGNRSLRGNMGV